MASKGVITIKQSRHVCLWGEKQVYEGLIYGNPRKEDGVKGMITVIKRDGKLYANIHDTTGVLIGEYEVVLE